MQVHHPQHRFQPHLQRSKCIRPPSDARQPNSQPCPQRMEPNHWRCVPTCRHGTKCQHHWTARYFHPWQMHRHFQRLDSNGPRWHPSLSTFLEWPQSLAAFASAHPPRGESFQPRWKHRGSKWQSGWPVETQLHLAESPEWLETRQVAMHRLCHQWCTIRPSASGSPKLDWYLKRKTARTEAREMAPMGLLIEFSFIVC